MGEVIGFVCHPLCRGQSVLDIGAGEHFIRRTITPHKMEAGRPCRLPGFRLNVLPQPCGVFQRYISA
jgi:hypothetical protein